MSSRPLLGEQPDGSSAPANGDSHVRQRWRAVYETLVAKAPTNGARVAESLDYEPVQNNLYFERLRARRGKRHYYGYSGLTFAKNLVMIMTGILTGVVCVGINRVVETLVDWRNENMAHLLEHRGSWAAFGLVFTYGMTLTALAACMVTFWAPTAAGAGVTLVMAYLNGNHIPNLLRFKTMITKIVGCAFGVASGLAIGPEGPMVHIGACIASNITYANFSGSDWISRWSWPWGRCLEAAAETDDESSRSGSEAEERPRAQPICATWEELHEDSEHREFISAGASAGLSAAFGAPIGGVLFSMEEACSFWTRKVAWRCFVAAILAAFSLTVLSEFGDRGVIVFTNVHALNNFDMIRQAGFIVAVAALGGFIGAFFNTLRRALWPLRASRSRKFLRIAEALLVITLSVGMQFAAARFLGQCVDVPEQWPDSFKPVAFLCPEGQHNDLATSFFSTCDGLLGRMFSVGQDFEGHHELDHAVGFTNRSLLIYAAVYLLMMALASGVCVPAGLFMPSIMLGASSGLTAGLMLQKYLSPSWHIQPGLYALVCATAVLAGVFRSAISLVVLVVEGTRGINFLFGIIVAVVVANWVANILEHDGVYESEIERDGNVFFLRHEAPRKLSTVTASDIMVPHPTCFKTIAGLKDVLRVLEDTTHHGFPVIEDVPDDAAREGVGRLDGLVLRSQLLVLLKERAFCDADGKPISRIHTSRRRQYRIERNMRLFYRLRYTHHRYMATRDPAIGSLSRAISRNEIPSAADGAANGGGAGAGGMPSISEALVNSTTAFDTTAAEERAEAGADGADDDETMADDLDELKEILGHSTGAGDLYLDLRPYMNTAPLTVRKEMSAARVHRTFVTLGMRHLCVVNNRNHVIGMITRKDLVRASHDSHGPEAAISMTHSYLAQQAAGGAGGNESLGAAVRRGLRSLSLNFSGPVPTADPLQPHGRQDSANGSHGGGNGISSESFAQRGAEGEGRGPATPPNGGTAN